MSGVLRNLLLGSRLSEAEGRPDKVAPPKRPPRPRKFRKICLLTLIDICCTWRVLSARGLSLR